MEVRDCGWRQDAKLANWLKKHLACAARENDVQRHFGIEQYVRPIDSAAHPCPNRC